MRPAGDVRLALRRAAMELATPDRGPTLQELAGQACVGLDAARHAIKNMRRSGELEIARERKVDYRNRPVAEYQPKVPAAEGGGFVDLGHVLTTWIR